MARTTGENTEEKQEEEEMRDEDQNDDDKFMMLHLIHFVLSPVTSPCQSPRGWKTLIQDRGDHWSVRGCEVFLSIPADKMELIRNDVGRHLQHRERPPPLVSFDDAVSN